MLRPSAHSLQINGSECEQGGWRCEKVIIRTIRAVLYAKPTRLKESANRICRTIFLDWLIGSPTGTDPEKLDQSGS